MEATQVVLVNKLVVVQAQIEEIKATLDGKPQTKEEFEANVAAIGDEMEGMIKSTTKSLGHGEVANECLSAQTQQLAQQNKKDNEKEYQTSCTHHDGPARSVIQLVDN